MVVIQLTKSIFLVMYAYGRKRSAYIFAIVIEKSDEMGFNYLSIKYK